MLDFDAGKLLIVGIVALVFIPPKDLPRVLRQAGQFVAKMRRMASEFQGQFLEAMREADMADIRREAQKLADAARIDPGLDSIHDLDRQMVAKRPIDDGPKPLEGNQPERTGDAASADRATPQPEKSDEPVTHEPPALIASNAGEALIRPHQGEHRQGEHDEGGAHQGEPQQGGHHEASTQ
jgi:Tat protein translocase TatB subunit